MGKLLGMFNKLPREVKLMVAMTGFATPIGIIFFLQRYLFRGAPLWLVTLGVAALLGVLALLGFVIAKLFGRAGKRRARKMEGELASGAEGRPVSMDLRAAVKANNEKFFGAVRDLRKLGISVYDLPWYVVLGDSGCGKTKLINEGGLTFSTGKPEGYQLGTLNYNWWFTEDAIFIDMAGRLCNPQEDADYREWEAFLRTVANGRRGYPINGVLCCVSAEHLLQDSPEQHEADANTMLERLRDLQTKLGVTFAAYLVVTKCDKILGFMQFFDRAERDITVKNQICGWSRPGDFNELRDPELFTADFDGLYGRLNELRLRRMQDDVEEFELGLAYSYPEEFRQLRDPLRTYVRTLFPAIKNPRAVKNLIFRGVYFTSATQQGGLILRHLAERLGTDVADQFPPLESMYPRPRPHFVKDLLLRKVFPEQGLVFRNEQEVVRNRKLARLLTAGTVVVGVALVALLIVSGVQFGRLIQKPRERAQGSRALVDQSAVRPGGGAESFGLVRALGEDATTLRASIWPVFLSLGPGAGRPAEDLRTIQMRVFERGVLRRALADVDQALRAGPIQSATGRGVPFPAFQGALREYLRWYGCAGQTALPDQLGADSLRALCGVAATTPDPGAPGSAAAELLQEVGLEQTRQYFAAVHDRPGWGNPARMFMSAAGGGLDPSRTVHAAVVNLHAYLQTYATLNETNPDPVIREWMRLRERCAQIEAAYRAILDVAESPIQTQEQLEQFGQVFEENYKTLTRAMEECTWQGASTGTYVRIPSLRDAFRGQLKAWTDDQKELSDAYATCGTPADAAKDPATQAIAALMAGNDSDLRGLQRVLWENIVAAHLADERAYAPDCFGDNFDKLVREVDDAYGHILAAKRFGDKPDNDRIELTADLSTVRAVLDRVHERLAAGGGGKVPDTPAEWVDVLYALLAKQDTDAAAATNAEALTKLDARWQRPRIERLNSTYVDLIRKATGTALLDKMEVRLSQVQQPPSWGLAELAPKGRETQSSAFYIPAPAAAEATPVPKEPAAPTAPPKAPGGPPPPPKAPGAPAPAEQPKAPAAPLKDAGAGQIPSCASPDFFNDRARECVRLSRYLADFKPSYYFARAGENPPRNENCINLLNVAWKRYCDAYVDSWKVAYEQKPLDVLVRVARAGTSWEPFATQFRASEGRAQVDERAAVRDEFQPVLSQILQALPWALYSAKDGWQPDPQDADYGPQNRRLLEAYQTALRERWPGATFARNAVTGTAPPPNVKPWEHVAAEFANRWRDWSTAAGKAALLPKKFDVSPLPRLEPIPWDGFTQLQNDTGLQDERFVGQLVEFQKKGQELLSAELTGKFCTLQRDTLGDYSPYGGWPYMNEAGTGATALETVPFEQFIKFLNLVHQAAENLQPLELGLPENDPVRRARQVFLQSSEKWRDFLKLTPQGALTPLDLKVETADPVGTPYGQERVDDSAQHWYRSARLVLGLQWQKEGGATSTDPLTFDTTAEAWYHPVNTVWNWVSGDQPEITVELVDGFDTEAGFRAPAIKARSLGKPSALALCAFLHRYGVYKESSWVATFGVNLADKFRESGHNELVPRLPKPDFTVGMKFYFRLPSGRDLPDAIVRLTPPAGGSAPGP